jgi:hypothetical protein
MVSIAEANTKIEKASVNMDRFDQIINGDVNAVIAVDGGSVRSLRGIQAYGSAGKSAYQIWLEHGNTGSEADFLASLRATTATGKFVP